MLQEWALLDGKTVLVTGVTTDTSIAFAVARFAQEQGAQVLIPTSAGRSAHHRIAKRLPEHAAGDRARRHRPRAPRGLPDKVREHLGDDATSTASCTRSRSAPETLLGGNFLDGPWEDVATRCTCPPTR